MSQDKVQFKVFGEADAMIDESRARTRGIGDVELMFLARARKALTEAGCSALDFLSAHPGISTVKMAQRLNRGASAIGLALAIYEEAEAKGVVRETVKELLIRKIHEKFPDGWSSKGEVRPVVKLGFWEDEACDYTRDPMVANCVKQIMKQIAVDHPPPEGWKPEFENDPLIDELFDRYWPVDSKACS